MIAREPKNFERIDSLVDNEAKRIWEKQRIYL
jgi:hypothetical protein